MKKSAPVYLAPAVVFNLCVGKRVAVGNHGIVTSKLSINPPELLIQSKGVEGGEKSSSTAIGSIPFSPAKEELLPGVEWPVDGAHGAVLLRQSREPPEDHRIHPPRAGRGLCELLGPLLGIQTRRILEAHVQLAFREGSHLLRLFLEFQMHLKNKVHYLHEQNIQRICSI